MTGSITLNPDTPIETVEPVLDIVHMVLVMTVQPGFGGQEFREECLAKVAWLRERKPDLPIEVDGGINDQTIPHAVRAGADTFVAGHAIFSASDPGAMTRRLHQLAERAAREK